MNYQDLGGPTPFNYRPDDDSSKLSTTLTPKVRKKLDHICNLFREKRVWKLERQMEKVMLENYILNLAEGLKGTKTKKKSKKKSNSLVQDPETVEPEDLSQDDSEKLIQIGGIYGYNEEAKSYNQFRYEQYCAIQVLEESRRRNRRRKKSGQSQSKDGSDLRAIKIQKLRQRNDHWSGLR